MLITKVSRLATGRQGLCFGIPGYGDPRSNREVGYGRFDIQIDPVAIGAGNPDAYGASPRRPRITIVVKFRRAGDASGDAAEGALSRLAESAIERIKERGYDSDSLGAEACGRLRWGVAFSGKRVAVACERA